MNNPILDKLSPIDRINYRFKTIYFLINICVLLAFVGIIIKTVFTSLSIGDEQGPAFATLVGYLFTSVALFGLLLLNHSHHHHQFDKAESMGTNRQSLRSFTARTTCAIIRKRSALT